MRAIEIEYLNSEINPHFANIVSPTEIVVVTKFHIELDGGGGDLHITMPYSMLEPLRELLDAGMQSDRADHDERWGASLREEVEDAEVELSTLLGRSTITLADLLESEAGRHHTVRLRGQGHAAVPRTCRFPRRLRRCRATSRP